jgi:predicted nucleotidyltransferase
MPIDLTLLADNGLVVKLLRQTWPNAMAVYAFGSQVQGYANAQSDLDVAILVGGYAEPLMLWEVASTICDIVGCNVDLLDLRAASTVMQYQVITTGRRLWHADVQADVFECFVLSEKTALDTARATLLKDIAAAGKIYDR